MCGIVGAFRPLGTQTSDENLVRMRELLARRGPDGAGLWRSADGTCVFGHRRLSIIDLSDAANQPMTNAAGTVALVFNGELYNHADVRRELLSAGVVNWATDHSDTEVLLKAYERWGLDAFHRFYGMFAVAIYDGRAPGRPLLHLVRDRVGIKPLYFTKTSSGEWLFASEIKALIAHPDVQADLDERALSHYFTFIVAPAPLTLFKGIFKIPAGFRATVSADGIGRAERYWDCVPQAECSALSDEEATDELLRLLRLSVSRRMVSDVPFGVLLSGGVDSSLNVALMAEQMSRPVTTFSVGYQGHESYNEFQHARRVSQLFKTDHHETEVTRRAALDFLPRLVELQDEPIADNVCIPLYFLAELVKARGTTVVQVGEGSDENFLGYWWCDHYRRKEMEVYKRGQPLGFWRKLRAGKPSLSASAEDREFARRGGAGEELFWGGAACFVGEDRAELLGPLSPRDGVPCPIEGLMTDACASGDPHRVIHEFAARVPKRREGSEVLSKIPYVELKLRLPEHLLMRVDKLTMAHGVEARVPFLDHDVVSFAGALPDRLKLRDGVGKWIVKQVASRFLPGDLVHRKKQGFGAPMEEWFKEKDFGGWCSDAWQRSDFKKRGLVDSAFVDRLIDHQTQGSGGRSFHLWTVMNAVLWHERWIARRAH